MPECGNQRPAQQGGLVSCLADTNGGECSGQSIGGLFSDWPQTGWIESDGQLGYMPQADRLGISGSPGLPEQFGRWDQSKGLTPSSIPNGVGHPDAISRIDEQSISWGNIGGLSQSNGSDTRHSGTGPTNGHWRNADWLRCTDGKWRPVEPWTFPLVNGSSSAMGRVRADQGHRAGRLKGYGNAINLWAAVEFINSFKEQIV